MKQYCRLSGFFVFLLVFLMASCAKKPANDQVIELSLKEIVQSDLPFQIERIIPLETRDDNLISMRLKVRKSPNGFLVKDEEPRGGNTKSGIYHFDDKGGYLGEVVSIGEGPGEIPNVVDFIVDDDKVEVLVSNGGQTLIEAFSRSGEKLSSKKLDLLADAFYKRPNGNYLFYGGYNAPIVQNRLLEADAHGKVIKTYLPNDYSGKLIPVKERNFSCYKGRVFFKEAFNNQVYSVSDTLETTYLFDFDPYSLPPKFWDLDFMEGFQLINENGFAHIEDYWESDHWALFHISIQKQGQMTHQLVLYNKQAGKVSRNEMQEESLWLQPIGFDENSEELLFLVHPKMLKQSLEKGALTPVQDITNLKDDDNPVLVYVKLEP